MPAVSMSGLAAGNTLSNQSGFGASLSAILVGHIFEDTQAVGIYEELVNMDDIIL